MLYMIYSTDKVGSLALRMATREKHLTRLIELKNEDRLIMAGPLPAIDSNEPGDAGFTGSLVIAEFENLAAAQSWANDDPYMQAGVYEQSTVKPYKKVLP